MTVADIIDPERDAEAIKRLAVAQALYKVVKETVATGDESNLRGQVDAIMAARFAQARAIGLTPKSFDIEIDGEKVGTYAITTTKRSEGSTSVALSVENGQELLAWACERGYVSVDRKAVDAHFAATGEVPDGCVAVPVAEPPVKGGEIARTTLRIDPERVAYSLGASIADVTLGFLEGGD